MEIEQDFNFEYSNDAEAGASTGSRSATSMPQFTEKELNVGLGAKVANQIESIFRRLNQPDPSDPGGPREH